jgi:hypothetical protein
VVTTVALTFPFDTATWHVRTRLDSAANALADRHYSRRRPGSGQVGPPGRKLVMVTPCERATWVSHWPYANLALDKLDAWRCTIFRNEGAGLASDLIAAAMGLTASVWGELPPDGWLTWVDTRKVNSHHPGYCFKRAGWWLDRGYKHPYLLRFRAGLPDPWGKTAAPVGYGR